MSIQPNTGASVLATAQMLRKIHECPTRGTESRVVSGMPTRACWPPSTGAAYVPHTYQSIPRYPHNRVTHLVAEPGRYRVRSQSGRPAETACSSVVEMVHHAHFPHGGSRMKKLK